MQVLFNYEWLHAKLSAMSLHDLLSDFQMAIEAGLVDEDVKLLAGALRLGGTNVGENPSTLAFDLGGRLLYYYADRGHDSIRSLLLQCDRRSVRHSALLPLLQCFDSPTAASLYVLEGTHTQMVSDLAFSGATNELVSVSKDGTVAFWDLASGECSRTIDVAALRPGRRTRIYLSTPNVDRAAGGGGQRYLIVDGDAVDSPVHVYDVKTARLLHSVGARLPNLMRGFLAGHLLCRQKGIVDVQSGRQVRTVDDFVESRAYVTCCISSDGRRILVGDRKSAQLMDFESGHLLKAFATDNMPSVMTITDDGRRAYVGCAINCIFYAFDVDVKSSTFGVVLMMFDCREMLREKTESTSAAASTPKSKKAAATAATAASTNQSTAVLSEQLFPRELSEINVSPANRNVVLLNVRRCLLIVLDVTLVAGIGGRPRAVDMAPVGGRAIQFSSFNFDGCSVLAAADNFLHVWSTKTGASTFTVNLHSTPGYPIAVSSQRNLVATGSTIHTAVRVWNLDRAQRGGAITPDLRVYECPVDLVACANACRLVFVKSYYGLASGTRGYKFVDSFGVDVWNVATGACRQFLAFGKYGKLLQMDVSPFGSHMALLLSTLRERLVVVIDTHGDFVLLTAIHPNCQSFVVSPGWEYLATWSPSSAELNADEIKVWDVYNGRELVAFHEARSPVFSFDTHYVLFIDFSDRLIIVYDLCRMAPKFHIRCVCDRLQVIPVSHQCVMATRFSLSSSPEVGGEGGSNGRYCEVDVYNFVQSGTAPIQLRGVASNGILDVSKDGRLAVDGLLQVMFHNIVDQLIRLNTVWCRL